MIKFPVTPDEFVQTSMRCQFGITEALGLFGIADLFSGAALGGEAALGAEAAATGATTLADITGTGTALFGGATGLEGTALAGGFGGGLEALTATAGLGSLGTAAGFLGAPSASALGTGAALDGGIEAGLLGPTGAAESGANAALGGLSGGSPLGAVAPQPQAFGGTSAFDTGTSPIAGVSSTGSPAPITGVTPSGASASSVAAPTGVTAPLGADPTAAATAATGATPTGAATGSTSIESLLGKAGNGALDSIVKNPLGIALGAGGLGYNILQGQKQTANQNALSADAATATANSNKLMQSGEALQQYLTSGKLPDAYQQQVDQAIADAKTSAISNAAQQGLPTDPTKNTALAATLAKIDSSRAGMQSQVAAQLFSSGSSLVSAGQGAAGLSGSLYQSLVNNDTTQAANTGKAIATLAAALNGKTQNTLGNTNVSVTPA